MKRSADDSVTLLSSSAVDTDELLVLDDDRFVEETVCIVTGAASGIGRATALAMAANGVTVLATDLDSDGLDGTVERADEIGVEGTIRPLVADLTDDDELLLIVEAAAELGTVRYLANIAGLQHVDPIETFPIESYETIQDVMVRAPFYLSKLCLPRIRATDDGVGCIGNMASIHGHYVTADKVAYNVAKFGIRGLTQSIAAEGEGRLRSFSVSTGYVSTPLVTEQIPETAEQRGISEREVVEEVMLAQSRADELMTPAEVANLFVFGFSSHGSHLNGGDLLFDGGMTTTYE